MDEELQLCLQKSSTEVQCLLMITKQEEKKNPTLSKPGTGCLYQKSTSKVTLSRETLDTLSQR